MLDIIGLSALGSAVTVWIVRSYALHRDVIDYPNARSSHERPTPRGGGVGIVLPVLGFLAYRAGDPLNLVMLGAVLAVALIGWMDDHRSLPLKPRLAVHVMTGVAVAWVAHQLDVGVGVTIAEPIVFGWWVFWTVSAINVSNFIDGIDAIVGVQLVVFAGFAAWATAPDPFGMAFSAVVMGSAAGFLMFNWPPARIFLGDVGSGAAGVLLVLLGILAMRQRSWTVVHAFLPLLPLFADEVITMVRRIRNRQPLTKPHRTHVYQRWVQAYPGHAKVTVAYGAAALGCAAWSIAQPQWNATFIAGAVVLLVTTFTVLHFARSHAERRIGASSSSPG